MVEVVREQLRIPEMPETVADSAMSLRTPMQTPMQTSTPTQTTTRIYHHRKRHLDEMDLRKELARYKKLYNSEKRRRTCAENELAYTKALHQVTVHAYTSTMTFLKDSMDNQFRLRRLREKADKSDSDSD